MPLANAHPVPRSVCIFAFVAEPNNNDVMWSSVWDDTKESGTCTRLGQGQWMQLATERRTQYDPDVSAVHACLPSNGLRVGRSTTTSACALWAAVQTCRACSYHPCVQAALIESSVPWNTTAGDLQAAFQAAYGSRRVSIVCDKK